MKKFVTLALVLLLILGSIAGIAEVEKKERTLRDGKYIIGEEEDIEPGKYTLTCIKTAGESYGEMYSGLGEALDSLDDSEGYSSMFGAFGSLFADTLPMTVEVVGDYGDVLKSYSMLTDDSITITLKEKTALKITDGSCTIVPVE